MIIRTTSWPSGGLLAAALVCWAAAGCGGEPATVQSDVPTVVPDAVTGPDEGGGDVKLTPPDVSQHPETIAVEETRFLDSAGETGPETFTPTSCLTNEDCPEGLCIQVTPESEEGVCTVICITEDVCPEGWQCKTVYIDYPDMVSVCIPPTDTLCRVCDGNEDCLLSGALCIQGDSPYGYCGQACNFQEQDCPAGFLCVVAIGTGGEELGHQCQPAPGKCCAAGEMVGCDDGNLCTVDGCHPTMGCQYEDAVGICEGPDPCMEYACQDAECLGVPITTDATNDGIDDDCDGLTDEDVPKLVKLNAAYFGSGGGKAVSDSFVLNGSLSCVPGRGNGMSTGFVLVPGLFNVKKGK